MIQPWEGADRDKTSARSCFHEIKRIEMCGKLLGNVLYEEYISWRAMIHGIVYGFWEPGSRAKRRQLLSRRRFDRHSRQPLKGKGLPLSG